MSKVLENFTFTRIILITSASVLSHVQLVILIRWRRKDDERALEVDESRKPIWFPFHTSTHAFMPNFFGKNDLFYTFSFLPHQISGLLRTLFPSINLKVMQQSDKRGRKRTININNIIIKDGNVHISEQIEKNIARRSILWVWLFCECYNI